MYCRQCEIYSKTGVTKETFCSECLQQKVVNNRSTSGFCEECSIKLHFCALCGDSLLSEEEMIKMQAGQQNESEPSNDENSDTDSNLEALLLERQNSMPPAKPVTHKNKIKPITPTKALDMFTEHMSKYIPDEMLDAVNELLIEQFKIQGDECTLLARDIMQRCGEKMAETGKDFSTYSEKIFSFAHLYAESGWLVTCEKPEDGNIAGASFKFSAMPQNETN